MKFLLRRWKLGVLGVFSGWKSATLVDLDNTILLLFRKGVVRSRAMKMLWGMGGDTSSFLKSLDWWVIGDRACDFGHLGSNREGIDSDLKFKNKKNKNKKGGTTHSSRGFTVLSPSVLGVVSGLCALSLVLLLVSNKSLSWFSCILIYCFSDHHHPASQFLNCYEEKLVERLEWGPI